MTAVFFRSIIVFVSVLTIMRFMGKRQLGEMQPFELVVTLIIADLACIPMADVSIPLIYGLIAIMAIVLIHAILVLLSKKNIILRNVFSGKSVVVINPNGIDYKSLNSLNMTISDLEESLRTAGYFSFSEIKYAIIETNGKLSAKPYDNNSTTTTLPYTVVSVGKVDKDYLYTSNYALEVLDFIKKKGLYIMDLIVFTVDEEGNVYYQEKDKHFQTAKLQKA
ncbi:MAG: DUF421 domain-containing protein [Clostridia bacterium]|nr:DUF421 domain-containing protein [Clostridia bacterium]